MLKYTWFCHFLIFQKEMALYTASKLINEFNEFDIDGDINPLFKVLMVSYIRDDFSSCNLLVYLYA